MVKNIWNDMHGEIKVNPEHCVKNAFYRWIVHRDCLCSVHFNEVWDCSERSHLHQNQCNLIWTARAFVFCIWKSLLIPLFRLLNVKCILYLSIFSIYLLIRYFWLFPQCLAIPQYSVSLSGGLDVATHRCFI